MLIQVSCVCGKRYLEREEILGHGSVCPACGHMTRSACATAEAPADSPSGPAMEESAAAAPPPTPGPHRPKGHSLLENDPEGWQQLLQYRLTQRRLRKVSYGDIALGVLTSVVGAITMRQTPINGLLLALGAMLIFEGIVLATRPTPWDLATEGLILLFVGVWNIVLTASHCADSVFAGAGPGEMKFVAVGIVQFFFGCVNLAYYRRLSSLCIERPTPEILRMGDRLLAALTAADPVIDPTILEFCTKASGWRARLRGNVGLFAALDDSNALVADKSAIEIEDMGKVRLGSARKARFWIGTQGFQGNISPEDLQRFRRWKDTKPSPWQNASRLSPVASSS